MSRKRDTNWTRDEITVLLDSIIEITQTQAAGGRRTNSREVFEYAAKKLGDKGHAARAEREKCRTKWKKMKEEFTHARRARETGQGRIAPGIEPFYSRMLEFINGSFDNISPHSTIVRRSSSISSTNINTSTNNSNNHISNNNNGAAAPSINNDKANNSTASSTTPTNCNKFSHGASRASARLAANSNGASANDTSDTSSTIVTRANNISGSEYSSAVLTPSDASPASRQNSHPSPENHFSLNNNNHNNNQNSSNTNSNNTTATATNTNTTNTNTSTNTDTSSNSIARSQTSPLNDGSANHNHTKLGHPIDAFDYDDAINPYPANNHISSASAVNNISHNNNIGILNSSADFTSHLPPTERDADISYRVSTGCRQITIFGDHDVDIKFRGDCVTINKIRVDYPAQSGANNNPDT